MAATNAVKTFYTKDSWGYGIAVNTAFDFYKIVIRLYARGLKNTRENPLNHYDPHMQQHFLGIMGCRIERMCAERVVFSAPPTPAELDAYKKQIAAARRELQYIPRNTDRIRRLFHDLVKGTPARFCLDQIDAPMMDAGDDINTKTAPAVRSPPAAPSSSPPTSSPVASSPVASSSPSAPSSSPPVSDPMDTVPMDLDDDGTAPSTPVVDESCLRPPPGVQKERRYGGRQVRGRRVRVSPHVTARYASKHHDVILQVSSW